ncbi:glycoside hydrolase [Acidianus sulfidivorans JP7]|uniref:Glycoside hydrolase n=1 Tax=Acidianus sulfidivorans JP7 TaxID=619593 RepID=A0A2U9IJI9_9CREN|nr:glycoside hydrolase [Acidianus sulfidivorans]AWR96145.1 glycoside hydrolase [Acidianus sulfidivorans JP7]
MGSLYKKITAILILLFITSLIPSTFLISTSQSISVNFTVSSNGMVTVYIGGLPQSNTLILHYGIENGPQQSWNQIFNDVMQWNGQNFSATIGPFANGTWIAWVFYDNTTGQWINYDNHPFWNWNLEVNPTNVGQTYATVLLNGSILITAIGRAPDEFDIHYGLTTGPQTGLPWSNITDELMTYNPLWGNYTIIIGPFKPGQWVQWVYHDLTLNQYYHNGTYQNFAIQDQYSFIQYINTSYNRYVYIEGQPVNITAFLKNTILQTVNSLISIQVAGQIFNLSQTLKPGYNSLSLILDTSQIPQGIYYPQLSIYVNNTFQKEVTLPPLYILNTTGKKPLSLVIVWNMHQPLYVAPNGSWEQPWVWLHTGQDFYWNGNLVGAYELQALLIKEFNVSVTIDFTPVLLYQWETILHEKDYSFTSNFEINVTHDLAAVNYTLNLYKQLINENKVEVLTVPFYHPLQPLLLQDGYWSDVLAQIRMGENFTHEVFGVWANGTWTPEMAFDMDLVGLYNESNISFTILDQQAFLPYVTLVNGSLNPDQPFIVENNLGQNIIVLFRNTTLSNEFGFKFFSQSPQLTAQELIQQLAEIYMNNPGGVVTVALDGENPLIFNPTTGPADLYAIYQALSQYQGQWLITQTASEAITTHKPYSVITNLPVNSWDLNLNYWNNGYPGKTEIWQNVSLAREYLIAYTVAIGDNISPLVYLPLNETPNSTSLVDTLWNYLYVAEGSDWTWQTGPPSNGPQWFKEQALLYTSTIISEVKQQFNLIKLESATLHGNHLKLRIYNGINATLHLLLVITNGNQQIQLPITLSQGKNDFNIKIYNASSQVKIALYSPVSPSQVGLTLIPINNYGFSIAQYQVTADNSTNSNETYLLPMITIIFVILVGLVIIMIKRGQI